MSTDFGRTLLSRHLARLNSWAVGALRSRTGRFTSWFLLLSAVGFLVAQLLRPEVLDSAVLRSQSVTSLAGGLCAFLLLHLFAAAALRTYVGRGAAQIWATAQAIKYLPAPGSALAGMVGGTVLRGRDMGFALVVTARHTTLLVGAAMTIGSVSVAQRISAGAMTQAESHSGLAAGAGMVALGTILLGFSTRGFHWSTRLRTTFLALCVWSSLGIGLWSLTGMPIAQHAYVASAFAAAWAVGLLALPIPAGLGVREATLVLLLTPLLSTESAIAFGVVTRLLHLVSDGLAVIAVFMVHALRTRR